MTHKTILAALALALTTIGTTHAQDPGPRLHTTAIDVSGAEVVLNLEDYRNIIGYRVYGKAELTDPEWTLLTDFHLTSPTLRDEPGASVHVFTALPTASILKATGFKFFKIHGVKGVLPWDSLDHTIVINLETYKVTRLSHNFDVSSDPFAKTKHLYLRRIKAGTFDMGSPPGEIANGIHEHMIKDVLVPGDYYIGVYPVTRWQYLTINGQTPSPTIEESWRQPSRDASWDTIRGAAAVDATPAGWLKTLEDAVKLANNGLSLGFDLPTEIQWEYACRAGTGGSFNNTHDIFYGITLGVDAGVWPPVVSDAWTNIVNEVAWWAGNNDPAGVKDVGLQCANAAGLYDMHGNTRNWCLDAWDGSAGLTGTLSTTGDDRAVRGGAYDNTPAGLRAAARSSSAPDSTNIRVGFRLSASGAVVPEPTP